MFSRRVAALATVALSVARLAAAEMCFDVNLRFGGRAPSRALVESMMMETSAIWQRYGVRIQWSIVESEWSTLNAARCEASAGSFDAFVHARALGTTSRPLGRTLVGLASIDHTPVYVDRGATERLLESLTGTDLFLLVGRRFAAPADVGRALGRVLAHEIGHVILVARGHQARGLMRRVFLAPDLVAPQSQSYDLSRAELERLREREVELGQAPGAAPPYR